MKINKGMLLYIYIDYVDTMLGELLIGLNGFKLYCIETTYCEDSDCEALTDINMRDARHFRDKLTEIKVDYCSGIKTVRETITRLKGLSNRLAKFQKELNVFYKKCEPYIVPYATTKSEWPLPVSISWEDIVFIKNFAEDPTFDEFSHGYWSDALRSILEYYRVKYPGYLEGLMKRIPNECPILGVKGGDINARGV